MAPPGQGGWGRGGGGGGGNVGGGGRGVAREGGDLKGREEIRKFLNFYKRRNSVCVDLYQPGFYNRKPNWEDLAEFVYSVLAVGGTSSPQQVRAAVLDVQMHPVKKLLFLKFTDQAIRDEVATRLQSGLVWPAFATTVTGWGMDKPVERIRVLGVSPETDEEGVRTILGAYGEILEARKGFISKKLPGCTNGVWTVKLILEKDKLLPPFLIMKEEGEVWQLATGEVSVCWKCGKQGHIGDKCHQDVSALAASLASPAETLQPSWAHVVSGARSGPQCPRPPPPPLLHARAAVLAGPVTEQALSRVQLSLRMDPVVPPVRDDEGKVIKLGKVLAPQFDVVSKAVDRVEEEETVVSKALDTVVDMMALDSFVAKDDKVNMVPSHVGDGDHAVDVQGCSMDVQLSLGERTVVAAAAVVAPDFCPVKKAKLSSDLAVPRDSRLRVLSSRLAPQFYI